MLCDEKREWMREYTVLGENVSSCILLCVITGCQEPYLWKDFFPSSQRDSMLLSLISNVSYHCCKMDPYNSVGVCVCWCSKKRESRSWFETLTLSWSRRWLRPPHRNYKAWNLKLDVVFPSLHLINEIR